MSFFLKRKGLPLMFLLSALGCAPDYFLLHPLAPAPGIYRESGFFDQGQLRTHWLARYPDGREPLPAILVHPDRGSISSDMEGICLDLARSGYFAVAAHYQRLENLADENPLIPWRSAEEVRVALGHLQKHPRVDPARIGVLGFSKGGVLSLQIASQDPSVKAVAAYYPLADFDEWIDVSRYSFPKSLLFRWVRSQMVNAAGAGSYEEARPKFREMSPINLADRIKAPVLLIHGEKDRTFPLEQIERLCRKLEESGTKCELMVIPGAGHVFNFLDKEEGKAAWERTLQFFHEHLHAKEGK
jgi:dienelactone hydrolase